MKHTRFLVNKANAAAMSLAKKFAESRRPGEIIVLESEEMQAWKNKEFFPVEYEISDVVVLTQTVEPTEPAPDPEEEPQPEKPHAVKPKPQAVKKKPSEYPH